MSTFSCALKNNNNNQKTSKNFIEDTDSAQQIETQTPLSLSLLSLKHIH